ncbi:MAG: hypothetical protein DRO23_00195 [Thermoprotei archaeon]|nr:MAG: hypothetical protein DRO23_00195 [Thermoprotei archaeon]
MGDKLVEIYVGPGCVTCKEMIEEISNTVRKLNIALKFKTINKEHEYFKKTKAPMTVFYGVFEGRLRYVGWMCCHMERIIERTLAILVNPMEAKVPDQVRASISSLNRVDVRMFTSPLCPTGCPDIAEALVNITAVCNNVYCTIIGAIEALDLMDELGISKIPTVILNNKVRCSLNAKSVNEAYENILDVISKNIEKFKQ